MNGRVFFALEGEDAEGAAGLGGAESGGFFPREGTQLAGALLDDVNRNLTGLGSRFGAGALRVGKDVEVGEWETLDKFHGGSVVCVGFARETGDDVGADGGVGKAFVDEFDAASVVLGAIPAMHGREDAVRSGLQGHVEMLSDAIGAGEKFDEVLRDVERLDGADAQAVESSLVENLTEEIFKFDFR